MTDQKYSRKNSPPPMRFQKRDGDILEAIHRFDGVLSRRQIKQMFWPNSNIKTMERRMTLLYHNFYLRMPSLEERRSHPIPEPVVWLGWRGILYVARKEGIVAADPKTINENQLRKLERDLRTQGDRWQREPRWSQLGHDIALNDFRLSVEKAVDYWPSLSLETWLPEGAFLTKMDTVQINGKKKGVRPDGFFILVDHMHQINNQPAKARFLVELDNSTHPVSRFGREKALAGMVYIRSTAYKKRFGVNSGCWLVVCKSKCRMYHLKAQTEKVLEKQAGLFYFTTLEQCSPTTVFNQPVWLRGGKQEPVSLVQNINVS